MDPKRRLRQLRNPDRWVGVDERLPAPVRERFRARELRVLSGATLVTLGLISAVMFGLSHVSPPPAARPGHLPAPSTMREAFTSSTQCPATSEKAPLAAGAASDHLVPFPVRRALVCRYGGMNSGAWNLPTRRVVLTSVDGTSSLAQAVNAAAAHRWGQGVSHCPSDDTSHVDLYFQGAGPSQQIEVQVFETGCAKVTNGTITDAQVPTVLRSKLTRLVGSPAARAVSPAGTDVPWVSAGSTAVESWSASNQLPACTLDDLTVWAQPRGGSAMSTYYQGVFVRNNGPTCSLSTARVAIVVGDNEAAAALAQYSKGAGILPADVTEMLQIAHPKLCARDPAGGNPGTVHNATLRLRFAGHGRLLSGAVIAWGGTCTGLSFGTWPTIESQSFNFKGYPNALPHLHVTIVPPASTDGGTMKYQVRLKNVGSTAFSPTDCPAFVQVLRGATRVSSQHVPLNCTGAGPIPAGASRTFDMVFTAPRDSDATLCWFLVGGPGA